MPQTIPNEMNRPGDEGQRDQSHKRQLRVDGDQDGSRHQDHQHIIGEVEQMQRQKNTDAVTLVADPGDQVARALRAEVLKRQRLQMCKRRGPQISTDPFADPRKQPGSGPAKHPRENRCD